MERREPSLVPEWLKNAGSSNGGGSIAHTDDQTASRVVRNKSFVNNRNNNDFGRSASSERTTSSYLRRSSTSNNSGNSRSYSSFGRNQRDREREKDKYDYHDQDKSSKGDRRYRYFSDSLGNTSASRFERDGLRRSHSMASQKGGEMWPKKVVNDSIGFSGKNTNGVLTRGSPVGGVNKSAFERDFPKLGAEERTATPEVGRVPSPGLSTAIQSLPGISTLIGGEKWTSALAEVPTLVGSNGTTSSQSSSASGTSSSSTISLNMAEAVAQGPNRSQTTPQSLVGTQRLEELVIKQSRQLIPVTPSLPKNLALNSADKQKSKVAQQQQQQHHSLSSSHPTTHSPRAGLVVKSDAPKASTVGKLQVLKPAREKNGVTPIMNDNSSPISGAKPVVTSPLSPAVSGPTSTLTLPNNMVPERKPLLTILEKRTSYQARSRNDFFNLMRKKSIENPSSAADSAVVNSPPSDFPDKCAELEPGLTADGSWAVEAPSGFRSSMVHEEKGKTRKDDEMTYALSNGNKHPTNCDPVIPEEEEAAFLRSLGWEENDDEEGGGLTDEEITSFYSDLTKYINSKPSLKILQGVQLKFLLPLESQIKGIDGLSDAKLES